MRAAVEPFVARPPEAGEIRRCYSFDVGDDRCSEEEDARLRHGFTEPPPPSLATVNGRAERGEPPRPPYVVVAIAEEARRTCLTMLLVHLRPSPPNEEKAKASVHPHVAENRGESCRRSASPVLPARMSPGFFQRRIGVALPSTRKRGSPVDALAALAAWKLHRRKPLKKRREGEKGRPADHDPAATALPGIEHAAALLRSLRPNQPEKRENEGAASLMLSSTTVAKPQPEPQGVVAAILVRAPRTETEVARSRFAEEEEAVRRGEDGSSLSPLKSPIVDRRAWEGLMSPPLKNCSLLTGIFAGCCCVERERVTPEMLLLSSKLPLVVVAVELSCGRKERQR
nr:hypothetical protein Iba_chr15aCG10870 [Ipomoea batatas]